MQNGPKKTYTLAYVSGSDENSSARMTMAGQVIRKKMSIIGCPESKLQ